MAGFEPRGAGRRAVYCIGDIVMQLNQPKMVTWAVALILGVIALILQFAMAAGSPWGFWLMTVAFVVIMASTVLKGL